MLFEGTSEQTPIKGMVLLVQSPAATLCRSIAFHLPLIQSYSRLAA